MSRRYFTLCIREDGQWAPQFGDYSKADVRTEMDLERAHHRAKDMRIVESGDSQSEINAAVAHLNAMGSEVAL